MEVSCRQIQRTPPKNPREGGRAGSSVFSGSMTSVGISDGPRKHRDARDRSLVCSTAAIYVRPHWP